MSPFLVVPLEINIQVLLHLIQSLIELRPSLNPEVLVKQSPVEAFNEAVALRSSDFCVSMFNPLQLKK
jgi:hypothetical protein